MAAKNGAIELSERELDAVSQNQSVYDDFKHPNEQASEGPAIPAGAMPRYEPPPESAGKCAQYLWTFDEHVLRPLLIYKYSWANVKRDEQFFDKFQQNAKDLRKMNEEAERHSQGNLSPKSGSYHSDTSNGRRRKQGDLSRFVQSQKMHYQNRKPREEEDLETRSPQNLAPTFGIQHKKEE